MGTGENFLNRTPIAYALRSSINKWDLIKLQSFHQAKDSQQDKTATNRLGKHLYHRGLIYNIQKELKKLDSRESNKPFKKWGTELQKEFLTEEY